MEQLTLVPAFGRDYRTHDQVMQAWRRGDSFALISAFGERYFDIKNSDGISLWVRYNRGRAKSKIQ